MPLTPELFVGQLYLNGKLHDVCLEQWISNVVPGPAASVASGNLLEMQILGPHLT